MMAIVRGSKAALTPWPMRDGYLLDRTRFAGVNGDAQPTPAAAVERALVVGRPEVGRFGPGYVDADHPTGAIGDRLLSNDLVQLEGKGAVEAQDETRNDRVLEHRSVHAPDRRADDVVQVLLAAAVALHRVEAQLHGGHVVLAVGAADDLIDRALDRDRRALDQLGPVEQLEIAVKAPTAPG
jgi:hypothetical protein